MESECPLLISFFHELFEVPSQFKLFFMGNVFFFFVVAKFVSLESSNNDFTLITKHNLMEITWIFS